MADDSSQRAAHRFFSERIQELTPFTKDELQAATGWADRSIDTYLSKQFREFLEELDDGSYRVRDRFRAYLDWKKFKELVTQVRTVPPIYAPAEFSSVIIYEFYIPLAHEQALRTTLDSLFYKDVILPRLRRIGVTALEKVFGSIAGATSETMVRTACDFFEEKFGGYSVYHVDGRFRMTKLATQQEAAALQMAGQQYLADETTAVVRFIFPCRENEAEKVRFLFRELFTSSITELISGEDEIWIAESGLTDAVHIWKPSK